MASGVPRRHMGKELVMRKNSTFISGGVPERQILYTILPKTIRSWELPFKLIGVYASDLLLLFVNDLISSRCRCRCEKRIAPSCC